MNRPRNFLWVRRLFGMTFLVLLLAQLPGAWGSRAGEPHCSASSPADLLVVMGAAQYDGRPSPAFARRLERALGLYELGCAPQILVTGGKQPGDRFTEGGAGARYLAERGVPEADLLSETESRSSFENLSFSKPFLEGKRLLIVTDDLHAYRTGLLARGLGLEAEVATVAAHGPRLPYLMREAAGVTAYFLGVRR